MHCGRAKLPRGEARVLIPEFASFPRPERRQIGSCRTSLLACAACVTAGNARNQDKAPATIEGAAAQLPGR